MTSTHPSAGGQSLPFECGYAHLGHIAKMFASGNFKAPMLCGPKMRIVRYWRRGVDYKSNRDFSQKTSTVA